MICKYCDRDDVIEVISLKDECTYFCCSNCLKIQEPKAPITRPPQAESFVDKIKHQQYTNHIKESIKAATDKVGTGLVLIPLYSLLALGKIFIEGLRYGRDNWKKGIHDKEYQEERLEHALLHLIKYKEGDASEPHLAKVAWFCFTQLELERIESQPVLPQENTCSIQEPTGWDKITYIYNTPTHPDYYLVDRSISYLHLHYSIDKPFVIDFCIKNKIPPFSINP